MTGSTLLQIFLFLNVFVMGALAAVAIRHARAHFKPHPAEEQKPAPQPAETKGTRLPPEVKQQMLEKSQTKFQAVLDESTKELQEDLKATAEQLNGQFQKLGAEVAGAETERYKTMLEELRKQTESVLGSAQTELATHQEELKAKLAEEVAAEKQLLIKQIDEKLADAVASFLVETLGRDVDLGAQSSYLTKQLEEHKSDFKRRISDEA